MTAKATILPPLGPWEGFGILVRCLCLTMMAQVAVLYFMDRDGWPDASAFHALSFSVLGLIVAPILLRMWTKDRISLRSESAPTFIGVAKLSVAVWFLIEIGLYMIEAAGLAPSENRRLDILLEPKTPSVLALGECFATAIREEIWYRWVLFRGLRVGFGVVPAAATASAVFALAHTGPAANQLGAFWIGICLSIALERYRALGVPIGAHALASLLRSLAW